MLYPNFLFMKHNNSLILICCTAGLALIAIVLMSCFGGSSHNEPLPSCSSIHTEKEDCPILDISLHYNLNNLYNKAKDFGIQNDLIELEVAHPGFYANQLSGTFDDFYPILGSADHLPNYSSDQLPSVEFAFSATDCSGSITRKYTGYDADLIHDKIITDAPAMRGVLSSVIMTAKSIKTNAHKIQLIWSQTISAESANYGMVVIDATAEEETEDQTIADAITKSEPEVTDNGGGRPRGDLLIYHDENESYPGSWPEEGDEDSALAITFEEGQDLNDSEELREYFELDDNEIMVEKDVIFSPILLQNVYSGGVIQENMFWSKPTVIEIITIE